MDAINAYLDSVFAALPKTAVILHARQALQSSMEKKYRALKADGKSESEAISMVISEFGDISAPKAMPVAAPEKETPEGADTTGELPLLDQETARAYMATSSQAARQIGLGVICCVLGVIFLILAPLLFDVFVKRGVIAESAAGAIGLIMLLIFVTVGVALFIIAGFRMERYAWLEQGFVLQPGLKEDLEKQHEQFMPSFTVAIIIGVGLCILSPIALFLSAVFPSFKAPYGLLILLAVVAVAVYLFVRFGMIKDGYARMLRLGDYTGRSFEGGKKRKKAEKITSVVASVVFPLAAAVYLLMGFLGDLWHPGWLIFPITGILFAIFSSLIEALVKK